MTDFNNDYSSPDQRKTAAGDPPETGSSGADSSYHYSGAQGSFGEKRQTSSAAGDFSYGSDSYQAEHAGQRLWRLQQTKVLPL